jgi:hypothetical protein
MIMPGGEDNADAVLLWRVSAAGCCAVCEGWDGEVFTLPELEEMVMPLDGPVHGCERGGSCTCTVQQGDTWIWKVVTS